MAISDYDPGVRLKLYAFSYVAKRRQTYKAIPLVPAALVCWHGYAADNGSCIPVNDESRLLNGPCPQGSKGCFQPPLPVKRGAHPRSLG
jgi:hypothetical protein